MSDGQDKNLNRESMVLRVLWMLVFVMIWQVGAWVLGALVLIQLIYRLVTGATNANLAGFGGNLSEYLAQIGRFGSFASEQKPWPFAPWPKENEPVATRAPENSQSIAAEEPKL